MYQRLGHLLVRHSIDRVGMHAPAILVRHAAVELLPQHRARRAAECRWHAPHGGLAPREGALRTAERAERLGPLGEQSQRADRAGVAAVHHEATLERRQLERGGGPLGRQAERRHGGGEVCALRRRACERRGVRLGAARRQGRDATLRGRCRAGLLVASRLEQLEHLRVPGLRRGARRIRAVPIERAHRRAAHAQEARGVQLTAPRRQMQWRLACVTGGGLVDVGVPVEQLLQHRCLAEPCSRVQRCIAPAPRDAWRGCLVERRVAVGVGRHDRRTVIQQQRCHRRVSCAGGEV
eukprot:scaffold30644_cov67-Phaeocystis_antarctica.AAC.3